MKRKNLVVLLEIVYFTFDMIHSHKIMNVNYKYKKMLCIEHKNNYLKVLWNVCNQKQRSIVDFLLNTTKPLLIKQVRYVGTGKVVLILDYFINSSNKHCTKCMETRKENL